MCVDFTTTKFMHLKQPEFTYSACGPFTKTKKEFINLKKQGILTIFTKMKLIKLVFNMIWLIFKDFARRTASDKVLRDKAFNIAKNPKYDGYQGGLASMIYKFFDKKPKGSGVNTHANDKIKQNQRPLDLVTHQLAEELHEPIIRKFKKRAVYSGSKDSIWGAELADMQLISKFNKGFWFLLCVIDTFSKHAWVVPLEDKKCACIVDTSQKY